MFSGQSAGLGRAILCWFLGNTLSRPLHEHTLFDLDVSHYALMAFLLVPALTLAVVRSVLGTRLAFRVEGLCRRPTLAAGLSVIFLAAFISGLAR